MQREEAMSDETNATAFTGTIKLPEREFSLPRAISDQARAVLRNAYANRPQSGPPQAYDKDGWSRFVEEREAPLLPLIEAFMALPGADIEEANLGGAKVYIAKPQLPKEGGPLVEYHIHGGGWVLFGGKFTAALTRLIATGANRLVYGVDYRMPPAHPYPAALDDCLSGYRELLKSYAPKDILVSGGSAGGNLASALMLRIADEGLPRPGALFLDTPAVDLTAQSDTLYTNQGIDSVIGIDDLNGGKLYANGTDLAHHYISPINGDLANAFPPTYLRSGTRDLLLSDTVRMHAKLRQAGIEADLYVVEGMPHGGLDGVTVSTPEDQEARADLWRWLDAHF